MNVKTVKLKDKILLLVLTAWPAGHRNLPIGELVKCGRYVTLDQVIVREDFNHSCDKY